MYKILFADDEPNVVEIVHKRLSRHGYEVLDAYDGKQALELTNKHMPDLIITDVVMPHMNGYEFCKHVKANPMTKDIPIVIVTANKASMEDSFLFLGIKDILIKPFDFEQLEAVIANRLSLAKAMHVQKTKIIFHCAKPKTMSSARSLIESVPQWASKFVTTGAQLLKSARDYMPDVIVVDLFMSDMPVDELISEIKNLPTGKNIQILTYYSPISEVDDSYAIQAKMIEVNYLKMASAAAGAKEYLGPFNNPANFIGLFNEYRKDYEQ